MFGNLKHKNARQSQWHDIPNVGMGNMDGFNKSSGATSFGFKGNEGSRMVRCRICGFPCDKERDTKAKYDTWAGLGISQGQQLTAGTSIGDRRVPAAGVVVTTVDTYYDRVITGGCPMCGCLTYWT